MIDSVRRDDGQTLGLYIVAVASLFFLAFAFFAVGQASVTRNTAQTAADAAALAAARDIRDQTHDGFLEALKSGDLEKLKRYLNGSDLAEGSCFAAGEYADKNRSTIDSCLRVNDPPGYTIGVRTQGTVGKSVVDGTENMHAKAEATAIIEPRCDVEGKGGDIVKFSCNGKEVNVDSTADGFSLDLSMFFTVHLSK